jgi:chemotaxis protein histidine kinase CheA
MEDFRRKFLSNSISRLQELLSEINKETPITGDLRQELFRTFHTIKGTSQVLGLKIASQIAHRLENSITGRKTDAKILRKGIENLIEALEGKIFSEGFDFQEAEKQIEPEILSRELVQKLSRQERKLLSHAVLDGKNIFIISKSFQISTFANEFRAFQSELSSYGEIIASLSEKNSEGFDFRFILITDKEAKEIEKNNLKIEEFFDAKLLVVINHLITEGKRIALDRNKEVEFEFEYHGNTSEFPENLLDFVFEILLHLVRNSVDHGITKQGKVKIEIRRISNNLILRLSDNGQGIDLSKLRKKAVEKGIIAETAELSEQKNLDLIFTHGLSTAEEISETSGRGVGLDVVKQKVEEQGGKITVKTGTEGTSFEIIFKNP